MILSPPLPLLVVFGLDQTLWPLDAADVTPPYNKTSDGEIFDSEDLKISYYPDVPAIFQRLLSAGVKVAVASTGISVVMTENLLELFDFNKYISYKVLLWMDYVEVFESLLNSTNVSYSNMLFYEDNEINIRHVSKMGVPCMHVPEGINMTFFETGIKHYQRSILKSQNTSTPHNE